jgi:hypothetical protein
VVNDHIGRVQIVPQRFSPVPDGVLDEGIDDFTTKAPDVARLPLAGAMEGVAGLIARSAHDFSEMQGCIPTIPKSMKAGWTPGTTEARSRLQPWYPQVGNVRLFTTQMIWLAKTRQRWFIMD